MVCLKEEVTQAKCLLEKKLTFYRNLQDIFHGYNDHVFQTKNLDMWLEKYEYILRIKEHIIWNQNLS